TLITDVEPTSAYHRMRPARPALVGNGESPLLPVSGWRRLNEPDDVIFTQDVEIPVGRRDRALPHAAIAPHHLACRKFEARENRVVEPVEIAIDRSEERRVGKECRSR